MLPFAMMPLREESMTELQEEVRQLRQRSAELQQAVEKARREWAERRTAASHETGGVKRKP